MRVIDFDGCKKIRTYLDSYLNNELLIETNHEVLKHLESCADCANELKARLRLKTLLRNAVQRDLVPASLEEKIRRDIRRGAPRAWGRWALAAAAALALMMAVWSTLRVRNSPDVLSTAGQDYLAQASAEVLNVGLGDHVHCAIDKGFSNQRFSLEKMSAELGPDYFGLVSLVKEKIPNDYEVTAGHRCRFKGRQFIHLILKRDEGLISLVITKKSGETSLQTSVASILEASGVPMYQARIEDLEVVGFETRDHLAFIVSNLVKEDNLQIASALAPGVRDFLFKLEV